jgi:rubrerythrin/uncharacterized damage-inducible protein DinB
MTETLETLVADGAEAYVRYLIAAERAVLEGNFNSAKILRALAYSHRAVAMNAARAESATDSVAEILSSSLADIDGMEKVPGLLCRQLGQVHERQVEIAAKAIDSLNEYADVPEWIIPIYLHTCINCGNIVEGDKPEMCGVCHVLGTEFESFGPYYASDAEHLGQLSADKIREIHTRTAEQIEKLIVDVDDAALSSKPSSTEWSIKEIIGHIIETDRIFLQRIKSIVTGSDYLQTMPPWKLHEGKGYNEMSVSDLMARLKKARLQSIARIENLTSQEWAMASVLLGGTRTVLDTGTWMANHDRGHVAQIKRLLEQ